MKLTKYEHACLFVESEDGTKVVIDPGNFTNLPDDLSNIVAVVATEEHADHFGLENIKKIVAANPDVKFFSTPHVADTLKDAGISYEAVDTDLGIKVDEFELMFYPTPHAPIYKTSPTLSLPVRINDFVFYSSDTFRSIPDHVEVVALPASGPWFKVAEAIDQVNATDSEKVVLTHNSLNTPEANDMVARLVKNHLDNPSRDVIILEPGESL